MLTDVSLLLQTARQSDPTVSPPKAAEKPSALGRALHRAAWVRRICGVVLTVRAGKSDAYRGRSQRWHRGIADEASVTFSVRGGDHARRLRRIVLRDTLGEATFVAETIREIVAGCGNVRL